MTFILRKQRAADVAGAFRRYREYLKQERHRFPPGALALATSEWYFDPRDHRCPHDSWLERLLVQEIGTGDRQEERTVALSVQLLGAYHELVLTFTYARAYRYVLDAWEIRDGHRDWCYDEFRIAPDGRLVHEVEWSGPGENARWLIEADDVALE